MADFTTLGIRIDTSQVRRADKDLDKLEKQSDKTTSSVKSLASVFATLAAGTSVLRFMKSAVSEQEKLQKNLLRTETLIKSTGAAAGFSAAQLHQQARQIALATLQSTEGIMKAQQVMLTFRAVSGDTFTRAIKLANDMSVTIGQDLKSSVTQVGKALQDPVKGINAMSRSGVVFNNTQKELIKGFVETNELAKAQKIILDELANEYGGIAEGEAKGLAGAFDTLSQRIEEFKINISENSNLLNNLTTVLNLTADAVLALDEALNGISTNTIVGIDKSLVNARNELEALESTYSKIDINTGGGRFSEIANEINNEIIAKEQEINSLLTARAVLLKDNNNEREANNNNLDNDQNNLVDRLSKEEQAINSTLNALAEQSLQLLLSEELYKRHELVSEGFTGAKLEEALAIWEYNRAVEIQNKLNEEAIKIAIKVRTPQEKFIADSAKLAKTYNNSELSLKDYQRALDKLDKQYKKSSTKDEVKEINKYEDALKDIHSRLKDVSATSLDIFSGPAQGINDITVALFAMSEALNINNSDIALNQEAWSAYNKSQGDDLDKTSKEYKEFYNKDEELNQKNINAKVQGALIVGGVIVDMLNQAATAAEEGSKKQESLQKAAAVTTVLMAGINAVAAIIRGAVEGGFAGAAIMAAAIIPLAATIGATVSQFGGGSGPSGLQLSQGRGTVLGDEEALSESLGNSMELLEDYAVIGNEHSSKMLISLQNIDNNTRELGKEVGRSDQFSTFIGNPLNTSNLQSGATISLGQDDSGYFLGQYEESAFGRALSGAIDGIVAVFSGGLSVLLSDILGESGGNVKDVGISLGAPQAIGEGTDRFSLESQTLGDILQDGAETYYFALVDQFTGIGNAARVDSFTANVFTKIEGSIDSWFSDILIDMTNVLIEGASFFDPSGTDDLINQIKAIELPFTKIDLTGLDNEEAQEAIDAVFSALGDTITEELFPTVQVFQQAGEGLFETFVRVTAEVENASTVLSTLGLEAIDYTQVLNKQNDLENQIVKNTILANTQFDNVARVMQSLAGDGETLVSTWGDLVNIQLALIGTGLEQSINLSKFIGASGGEGAAQSNLDDFIEGFFSEEEQFGINLANLQNQFESFNQVMPASRDGFVELINSIDATSDEGAILLANMLSLSGASADLADEWDDLKGSLEEGGEAARLINEMLKEFSRLGDSAITSTLNSVSDQFIDTLDAVIEAGGSIDDMLLVVTTGIWSGIIEMDKAKDSLNDSFIALGKVFDERQRSISFDILKITTGSSSDAEKEFYEDLLQTGDFDERMEAASTLQSMIMENYEEQIASVEEFGEAIQNIQGYINDLLLNDSLTVLTPIEQLNEAERQFSETLSLAQSGDINALNDITNISDTLLDNARVVFASSQDYTDIFNRIIGSLSGINIPSEQNFDKINADASLQAVTELENISSILDDIRTEKTLEFQQDLQLIDQAGIAVFNDFISAVSSLTGYTSNQITGALDTFAVANDINQGNVYDYAGLEVPSIADTSVLSVANPNISDELIQNYLTSVIGEEPNVIRDTLSSLGVSMAQVDNAMSWPIDATESFLKSNNLPLFANGGIATSPSIISEFGQPEAAVPLPDGRSIPVTIRGDKSYRELIAEIQGLRNDMAEHTSAVIDSNYDANEQASSSINNANRENTESNQWQDNKVAVS